MSTAQQNTAAAPAPAAAAPAAAGAAATTPPAAPPAPAAPAPAPTPATAPAANAGWDNVDVENDDTTLELAPPRVDGQIKTCVIKSVEPKPDESGRVDATIQLALEEEAVSTTGEKLGPGKVFSESVVLVSGGDETVKPERVRIGWETLGKLSIAAGTLDPKETPTKQRIKAAAVAAIGKKVRVRFRVQQKDADTYQRMSYLSA